MADQATIGGVGADQLRSFVERVERLESEKTEVQDQIKDVYAEAKNEGFDIKTMRQIVRLRKMKPHDRSEQEELLELYKSALGIL